MKSLTLQFFLAFWLIILVLAGLAAGAGYAYSERMREALENFEISDTVLAASEELESGGRAGLVAWLRRQPDDSPVEIFVVDADGAELLGREIPRWARRMLRRFDHSHRHWGRQRDDRPNLRLARPLTRLRGPDGDTYTLFSEPRRPSLERWLGAGPAFLVVALLLSAGVSLLLARAISRPVRSFREATVAIANGKLDTRVSDSMRSRRDEIGNLARDLDAMAEKLERAAIRQTELMQNVSHELRSPLARLRVALELARRDAGDRSEFARIEDESERLDELIGQLLSYSRMQDEAGRRPAAIELDPLLDQVTDDANFECRSSGLDSVSVSLDSTTGLEVVGSAPSLASAFENVLRNAIHHSPAGGRVSVSAARAGDVAEIRIRDEGPGVDAASLEKIFEPFYRSADAMASGRSGAGLGLAIAARAVESSGGSIRAANREGGFEITIRLTLSENCRDRKSAR